MTVILILLAASGILSFLFTFLLRVYAIKKNVIDRPNARSAHTTPTPRGGGLSFVFVFFMGLPVLTFWGYMSYSLLWGLLGAGALIAFIGFLDDRRHIPARWRLLVHFIAAAWLLYWLGSFRFEIGGLLLPTTLSTILLLLYLVWLLNLYNFMDGINGIASVEAISTCVSATLLYGVIGYPLWGYPLLLLTFAVFGFLPWNFPRARIFMGDAGSGFLGIMLGGFSIYAGGYSFTIFVMWLILLAVFIVDATWTLICRLLRREKLYEAHASHAYQILARYLGNHSTVTLIVLCINCGLLLPLAYLVVTQHINAWIGLVCAYVPLSVVAFYCKAGRLPKN